MHPPDTFPLRLSLMLLSARSTSLPIVLTLVEVYPSSRDPYPLVETTLAAIAAAAAVAVSAVHLRL